MSWKPDPRADGLYDALGPYEEIKARGISKPRQCDLPLTMPEAHMLRQWFDHVFDTNPRYLEHADLVLGAKLHEACGMRVSNALRDALQKSTPST